MMLKRVTVLLLCFVCTSAFAQVGGISGAVVDPNGQAISGAELFFTRQESGRVFEVQAVEGEFSLTGLPSGTYTLNIPAECCRYSSYSQYNIVLFAGTSVVLRISLDWEKGEE